MGKYVNYDDIVNRYRKASSFIGGADEMDDAYIQYAEAYIEGELTGYFAIPFSDNNLTAKDLCIDATFAKALRFKDDDKADKIMEDIKGRLEMLKSGQLAMAVSTGDPVLSNGAGQAWSNTKDYHPAFGVVDHEYQQFDEDQINDELDDRYP